MHRAILAILGMALSTAATAQVRGDAISDADDQPPPQEQQISPPTKPVRAGRLANTGNGEVGQRQTRQDIAPNVEPMGRIDTRLANRVQNRLSNRIDRDYDPDASSRSPFEDANRRLSQRPR